MHFLIITYDEYINIPYIKKYEEAILTAGNTYDVILWNRRSLKEKHPSNHFVFQGATQASKLSKIIPFLRWRQFVKRRIACTKYDKLIILTTIPAVLLIDILLFNYGEKFLFDIRDFTYEGFYPYRYIVNWLVRKSSLTTISSKGFLQFIKENPKVFNTHNISNTECVVQESSLYNATERPLVIGFVGGVRYYKENVRIIQQLGNNDAYQLQYVGKVHPGSSLQNYCQTNNITNVSFLPAYANAEKPLIYQSIDIINAVYGSGSPEVTLALPNKLYDCIVFKKPIMVSKGTYLATVVEQYHLGFAVDVEKDDIVLCTNYYLEQFDQQVFLEGCQHFLTVVQQEEAEANLKTYTFCRENYSYELG